MTTRVALLAELGVSSIGNDASAAQVIAMLEAGPGDVDVTILSREPAAAQEELGRPAWDARARWAYRGPMHASGAAKVVRLVLDLIHLLRIAGRFDVIVVPGTGALEVGQGGLPRGTLLSLLLAGVAARCRRTPYLWLAVGGSRYSRRLTRWTVRAAAATACIRSYRDVVTLEAVRSAGVDTSRDVLMDDVVIGRTALPPRRPEVQDGPVVVSVIDVPSAAGAPEATDEERRRYSGEICRFVAALLDRGERVRVVVSDAADVAVARQVVEEATRDRTSGTLTLRVPRNFDEVLRELAGARVVIGSRFHILIAAALDAVPFVAVEHADKVGILSEDLGLGAYRVGAHTFRSEELVGSLDAVTDKRDALSRDISAWVDVARERTLHGYDEVLARLERRGVTT
ncbi:polysaccharide pyruvyl transferase family protein [Isoptericola sp. AK164]|uniref:polysaccharide pyruvyl transferase family protein n=1 Tax=Isoptericola sp. AK164 TaxID=3024246 RepID=UPI0024184B9B|nr:polysaccharide pyruvyl transferase family protein [Isoptericola sp. AK164]